MAELPSMSYYGDAYMADTRHLTLAEHGAYHLLLLIAWRSPNCALPDDDKRIAQMLGVGVPKWLRIKPAVMDFWQLGPHGWQQKRQLKEFKNAQEKRAKCSASANARWNANPLENNGFGNANAYPNEDANADATITITSKKEISNDISKKRGTRLPDDWQPSTVDIEFAAKAGHTGEALAGIVDEFRDYWHAQPGQRGVKLDWEATWRNWIRREGKARANGGGRRKPKFVSDSGFEYFGSLEEIRRKADQRHDMKTYWAANSEIEAARSIGSVAARVAERVKH